MKRRGFLGFMGGAAVAGPSMAKAAAVQGLESLSLGGISTGAAGAVLQGTSSTGQAIPYDGDRSPLDPKHWMQRELTDFLSKSAQDLMEERINTYVDRLDPDLASMRSISVDAKIRIQRDRNFARNRKTHEGYLRRELKATIKRWSEK